MGRGRDAGEQAGGRGLERRSKSGEEGGENGGERGAFLPPVNTLPFERWKRPARAYPSQFEKAGAGPKRRGTTPSWGGERGEVEATCKEKGGGIRVDREICK